jgi:hypothetical protein
MPLLLYIFKMKNIFFTLATTYIYEALQAILIAFVIGLSESSRSSLQKNVPSIYFSISTSKWKFICVKACVGHLTVNTEEQALKNFILQQPNFVKCKKPSYCGQGNVSFKSNQLRHEEVVMWLLWWMCVLYWLPQVWVINDHKSQNH